MVAELSVLPPKFRSTTVGITVDEHIVPFGSDIACTPASFCTALPQGGLMPDKVVAPVLSGSNHGFNCVAGLTPSLVQSYSILPYESGAVGPMPKLPQPFNVQQDAPPVKCPTINEFELLYKGEPEDPGSVTPSPLVVGAHTTCQWVFWAILPQAVDCAAEVNVDIFLMSPLG